MSDEEMAKAYIVEKYALRKDLEIWRIEQDDELSKEFYGYIAGLKAGREQLQKELKFDLGNIMQSWNVLEWQIKRLQQM